ncbi:CLUMA_CG015076, isoform A [Clunio marinus]|uniref:CLUMA_CG015076, isoform A n=1 Tax=Clunio marinus TaxID=568069 RepID=A0A1J1IPV7_9DIPT|nr:CLUMA_CG015076, isoform A [Clunio marinus]
MFKLSSSLSKDLLRNFSKQNQRELWWWTVIMFNKMDEERTKTLGYDRTTAEWVLRNGGCVRFIGSPLLFCDYNTLPPENTKFFVKEIEATDAGLNTDGFDHIKGCHKLDRIFLKNCKYLEDDSLKKFMLRKDSLKIVEIIQCKNLTDDGLQHLTKLINLEKLIVHNLPYVKHLEKVQEDLRKALPKCTIQINP